MTAEKATIAQPDVHWGTVVLLMAVHVGAESRMGSA